MIKLAGSSNRLGVGDKRHHHQLRVETDEDDGNDNQSVVLMPEVNFDARDEFNLKFFENTDDNCFSEPGSVESCTDGSPDDQSPIALADAAGGVLITETDSPEDWMDSLMQTISEASDYRKDKAKIGSRRIVLNNNEGEEYAATNVDKDAEQHPLNTDRTADIFCNLAKIGECIVENVSNANVDTQMFWG